MDGVLIMNIVWLLGFMAIKTVVVSEAIKNNLMIGKELVFMFLC